FSCNDDLPHRPFFPTRRSSDLLLPRLLTLWVCKLLMLICILTKNVITSCSVTMMLFLHLEVKPLMTLTTVLYLSCALISGHLARSEERFSRNAETALESHLLLP